MTNKEYKRLTTYNVDFDHPAMTATRGEDTTETIARHIERLYELENAIENGALVFLPCKPGDTVYYANKYFYPRRIEEYIITAIEIRGHEGIRCLICSTTDTTMNSSFLAAGIGDYIFTTKEAAEKALEEVKQ